MYRILLPKGSSTSSYQMRRILREGQARKIVSRFGLRLGLQFRRGRLAPLPSGTVHWRAITRLG